MKSIIFRLLQTGATVAAAAAARNLAESMWRGDAEPPVDPGDRNATWREAALWAAMSGVLAGVARVLARRGTAAGWEKAVGEPAPA